MSKRKDELLAKRKHIEELVRKLEIEEAQFSGPNIPPRGLPSNAMGKVRTTKLWPHNDPQTLMSMDNYAHGQIKYDYKGNPPIVEGQPLNRQFDEEFHFDDNEKNIEKMRKLAQIAKANEPLKEIPDIKRPDIKLEQVMREMFPTDTTPSDVGFDESNYSGFFADKIIWIWEQWKKFAEAIGNQWEWKDLPNEIPSMAMEFLMFKGGSCAFFKVGKNYYVSNYETESRDIYGNATKIKLINDADKGRLKLKNRILNEGQFVIMKDNECCYPLYNIIYRYMNNAYEELQQLTMNSFSAQDKEILINNSYVNKHGQLDKLKTALNSIKYGRDRVYVIDAGADVKNLMTDAQTGKFEVDKLGYKMEGTDLSDMFIKTIEYWFNKCKEDCGLQTNLNFEKKERLIGGEVNAQNGLVRNVMFSKWKQRDEACQKINEIWTDLHLQCELRDEQNQDRNGEFITKKEAGEEDD
jgi:hypothetical protein